MGSCSSSEVDAAAAKQQAGDRKDGKKRRTSSGPLGLTSEQLKLIEDFYALFNGKNKAVSVRTLSKYNASPKEEICKLFNMVDDSGDKMTKEGIIKLFAQARASFVREAGNKNGTAFVSEMLIVLLKTTRGEMSEDEGNRYLVKKSADLGIDATDSMLFTPSISDARGSHTGKGKGEEPPPMVQAPTHMSSSTMISYREPKESQPQTA
mmetsp:Transcript_19559/g.34873  ORF Transcript_19559/g.34873 Transcript_19559/m.34873 type:complete len:208 (+) Transcript_19559:159-782(+)